MDNEHTIFVQPVKKKPKLFVFFNKSILEYGLAGLQTFGRTVSGASPDIAVSSGVVSRKHGDFVTNENGTWYRDTGSTNGTLLNRNPVRVNEPVRLQDGDVLYVRCTDSSRMDVVMIYSTSYTECEWKQTPLSQAAAINIGRHEELKLNSREVSRKHASFFLSSGGWAIIDHGSTNGVYRNNRRIGQPEYIQPFDVIKIASYLFIYTQDALFYQCDLSKDESVWQNSHPSYTSAVAQNHTQPLAQPYEGHSARRSGGGLSIDIVERSVVKRIKKKMLLKDVKLDIPSGSMVLILGGSGAGKTTFMNAVMGYEQAKGSIKYNNTDIYAEFERMQFEIGYVPQQDLMRMNDIALDTVVNAAQLKLPAGMGDAYYVQQAERAMETLGLADEKTQLVRALSGGQRKRLSIAMEYVGNPSLFFLDEPDSGVDNTNSELLLNNLRSIANEGKIVMFISHSPDRTIKLIDKIIVLAKDSVNDCGRLVFYGNPYDALKFFDVENLNKIVSRINKTNEGGEGLADYYIDKFQKEGHLYG